MPTPFGPQAVKVSQKQMRDYNRTVAIANNPGLILEHVKNGTLLPSDLETANTLYPGMTARYQSKALERLTSMSPGERALMSNGQKGSLSLLLGMPVTNNYTPQGIMSAQTHYAKLAQMPKAPKLSGATLKAPTMWQTGSQRTAAKRNGGL